MRRSLFPILMVLCIVLYSCKDNVVCPAFQSTYILNDSMRMARYSLFLNDSTPKVAMASRRKKSGVNKKIPKLQKKYELMTAPKENVLGPPKKDPLYYNDPSEDLFIASDFVDVDSIGVDSVSAAPLFASVEEEGDVKYKYRYHPKNAYNEDQEYYNKYYGDLFIDTRPSPEELEKMREEYLAKQAAADTVEVKEKKGLFKRKKEEESDNEAEVDLETLEEIQEATDEAQD